MDIKVLKKVMFRENKECGEGRKAIELIGSKKSMLVNKRGETGCFSKKIIKKNVLCLNIRAGENKKGGEGNKNKERKEVAVFEEGGKTELIKLKELDILVKDAFGSEL